MGGIFPPPCPLVWTCKKFQNKIFQKFFFEIFLDFFLDVVGLSDTLMVPTPRKYKYISYLYFRGGRGEGVSLSGGGAVCPLPPSLDL